MRLFTAIDIPDAIRDALDAAVRRLQPVPAARWSKPGNFHVTTKFLGEVRETQLAGVIAALEKISSGESIGIEVTGLGCFPNLRSPRLLFADIQAPASLQELHHRTDRALVSLGIPAETKRFRPHLTLARLGANAGLPALRDAVSSMAATHFGAFTAERFYLYESVTGGSGSVYTKLAEFKI